MLTTPLLTLLPLLPLSPLLPPSDAEVELALLALLTQRGPNSSACPSEVARQLRQASWRELMPNVRRAAVKLALGGSLQITQRGLLVPPTEPFKGPIRIKLTPEKPNESK